MQTNDAVREALALLTRCRDSAGRMTLDLYNDIQEFLHTNQTHNTHEHDHTILHPDQYRSSENVSEVRLHSDS